MFDGNELGKDLIEEFTSINANLGVRIAIRKNMLRYSTIFSLLFVTLINCSNVNAQQSKRMALVNGVTFHNTNYGNNNAGNGFIVNVKGKDYAITAKHILMIVKTDKMESVDFSGELKQWKMFDKNNPSHFLIVDQLINANKAEKLEWQTLQNDWIVFSIKENKTENKPLKFRNHPLIKGEKLYVVGWAYQDKEGPQRTYEFEFDITEDDLHTFMQIKGPKSLAGLSGSPIVDAQNRVVGLVSTGWLDEESNVTYLQASKGSDVQKFIENYSLTTK